MRVLYAIVTAFLVSMNLCFPAPDALELKAACQQLIQVQRELRDRVDAAVGPAWTTTEETCRRVARMVGDLFES